MVVPPRVAVKSRRLVRLVACLGLFAGGLLAVAQDPPPEVEDPKGGVKKAVIAPDGPEPKPRPGVGNAPDSRLDALAREADAARHPEVKALLRKFIVPFDYLTEKGGATARVRPFPRLWGATGKDKDVFPPNKAFEVTDLDEQNTAQEPRVVVVVEVKTLEPFELLVLNAVNQWLLTRPSGLTPDEHWDAAESLLVAALEFHDYAKDPGGGRKHAGRAGKHLDSVRAPLVTRLREVRLMPLAEAETLLKGNSPDYRRVRLLLNRASEKLPDGGGKPADKIRDALTAEAGRLAKQIRADLVASDGRETPKIQEDVALARVLDPAHPDVMALAKEMKGGGGVMVVAVRRFPERMSPATARYDSERQAVELMFEGLLEEIPSEAGLRYRAAAAAVEPSVSPGSRGVLLRNEPWAGTDRGGLDPHDVIGTLRMLQKTPELWAAAGLPWLNDLPTPEVGGVRIGFQMGHPDPRVLLTFKVLPAQWLTKNGKTHTDTDFSAEPFGTGPYLFAPQLSERGRIDGPRVLVFKANREGYSKGGPDRAELPHIPTIRLVEAAKLTDPVTLFRNDLLHILPDVPTAELKQYDGADSKIASKVRVATAATNRRVHILAVNHRRSYLQSVQVRRGLSLAIDRDKILTEVFRAGRPEFHQPLAGPFPPACWATPKGPSGRPAELVNADLALTLLRGHLARPDVTDRLTLCFAVDERFPEDLTEKDPTKYRSEGGMACARIKAQVEGLFGAAGADKKLTLVLEPLARENLTRRVYEEFQYDLAYVPLDYPDDWFPLGLGSFLDKDAAGRGGRNVCGYHTPGAAPKDEDNQLMTKLQALRGRRDFAHISREVTGEVHQLFNDSCVPFVPLWQLDRHMVVHRNVQIHLDDPEKAADPRLLNPTLLFQGVARWKLK